MHNELLSKKNVSQQSPSFLAHNQTPSTPSMDTFSNSTLVEAMNTLNQINPHEGTTKHLPDALRNKLENHFSHRLDNLSFKESPEVSNMGIKAYTKGNVIIFAPGQFNPETSLGQKMIAHEIEHVKQQASGVKANAMDILNYSPALESAADRAGDDFLSLPQMEPSISSAPLTPIPSVSSDTAPIQGWGAGGLLSFLTGKTKLRKGEHEELTRTAGNLADTSTNSSTYKDHAKSLKRGARFNDVYHSKSGISFGLKYVRHNDAFVNQSHHGDMQFLHSMSSGDSSAENKAKAKRWVEFCIDTRQNITEGDQSFQSKNMLDYVLQSDDTFQDMMLSTMLDASKKTKETDLIERQLEAMRLGANDVQNDPARQQARKDTRRQLMITRLTSLDAGEQAEYDKILRKKGQAKADAYKQKALASHQSKYAKKSIGEFFTGGHKKLDAGIVATGSLSHMLEDSVADSHGQRVFNTRTRNGFGDVDVADSAAVLGTLSPIMLHANYDEQDESKHGLADFMNVSGMSRKTRLFGHGASYQRHLQESINQSEGARQGQLMAAHMMTKLSETDGADVAAKQGSKAGMLNFLDRALAVDENALILQQAATEKQAGGISPQLLQRISQSDLAGLDFQHRDISTTLSGRQYQKGELATAEGTQASPNLKAASDQYETLLASYERGNTAYSPEDKLGHYNAQIDELAKAMFSTRHPATIQRIRQHLTEILLNLSAIKTQQAQNPDIVNTANRYIAKVKNYINL